MNKLTLMLLAPLALVGFMASAGNLQNGDLAAAVLKLGHCYTPKHRIQFYENGSALLIPATGQGGNSYNPYGDSSYGGSYSPYGGSYTPGVEAPEGVWTSWKVSGPAVYVLWPHPKYWAPLLIGFGSKTCSFPH